MKYAPMTPAIAPLAPTVGMVELAFSKVWNRAAATPHSQVEDEIPGVPHVVFDVVAEDPERTAC